MPVLWILLGIVVITVIVLSIIFAIPRTVTTQQQTTNIPCNKPLDQLPDVSDTTQFTPCYQFNSSIPDQRYYDSQNDWTVLQLDRSVVPSAAQVCIEFCSQVQFPDPQTFTCLSQDTTYNNCMTALSPVGCNDAAQPVAKSGSIYYYAIGRGRVSCYPSI